MGILLSITSVAGCNQPPTGEHLNGAKYERYEDPDLISNLQLDAVLSVLEEYAKEHADDQLLETIERNREQAWVRVDFEYLEYGTGKAVTRAKVGVHYRKGGIEYTGFQNLTVVSFFIDEPERRAEKMYYITRGEKPKVTHVYSF